MAAQRVGPDDLVYQVENKWFGTSDFTFPVTATYVAWGLWLFFMFAVVTVERALGLGVGFLLLREVGIAAALATASTQAMSYDKPLRTLIHANWGEIRRMLTFHRHPRTRVFATLRVAVTPPVVTPPVDEPPDEQPPDDEPPVIEPPVVVEVPAQKRRHPQHRLRVRDPLNPRVARSFASFATIVALAIVFWIGLPNHG